MFNVSQRSIKTVICIILLVQMLILVFNMIHRKTWISMDAHGRDAKDDPYDAFTTAAPYDNDTLDAFLAEYEEYCEENLRPRKSNYIGTYGDNNATFLCPCIPDSLG